MITVVMPVYNESDQIYQNVRFVGSVLNQAQIEHQFLLVDDGSTDSSWDELRRLSSDYGNIAAIRLSRNFGKELALCAALEHASGDAVVVMDCDLQHPAEKIIEMERLWREQHYDVVEGVKAKRGKESLGMKIAALSFYNLFRKTTGIDIGVASDFKLLDRKVVEAWRAMPERDTFFRGMSAWVGFRRIQLPFDVQERAVGKTKWSVRGLMRLAVNSMASYTAAPLYLIGTVGLLMILGMIVVLIQTLIMKILGFAQDGFTTVIILILLVGGCLMISLATIGLYLSKVYEEVKSRPRYIISSLLKQDLLDAPD